jgi:hypothetical protein
MIEIQEGNEYHTVLIFGMKGIVEHQRQEDNVPWKQKTQKGIKQATGDSDSAILVIDKKAA